jgi:hypothetical protein
MHRVVIVSICLATIGLAATVPQDRQEAQSPLAGRWLGKVVANVGEMPIEVVVTVADGKVTGEIRNFHGAFRISGAELEKDGRWKLSFSDDDGGTGTMTGAIKGDAFAGDWDYSPNAVGKFELTRVKK